MTIRKHPMIRAMNILVIQIAIMKTPEASSTSSRAPGSQTLAARYRVSEFQEEKVRNYNQLQEFYMPFMKKLYEDSRDKNPNIRPPEDLLINSQLLSMKEADMTRKIETLHKDNEAKQAKIREMVKQVGSLVKRLKPFDPTVTESTTNFAQDNERLAKRYESLMKIKADETFFALKMKGIDLLKQFGLLKEEAEGINHMQTESEVFDFILNKLKLRIKDYKSRQKENTELSYKQKAELDRYSERLQYLTETNQQLKNNQLRLKQKVDDIKKQWSSACDRLISKQKQLQQKDNQIYKLKRLIDQKQNSITLTASKVTDDHSHLQLKTRDLQQQLRDMRVLLSMYNLQKSQLQATIDQKQSQLQQNRIRDKFNQQQYEKVLREAARWKERYEWVEKDRETKAKVLETKNTQLESEIKMLRVELESGKIQLTELQAELEESRMGNRRLAEDLEVRDGEIGRLEQRCAELEESLGSRVSRLEEEYVSKYKNLEKQRDTQIYNAIQNKEEEFRKEWKLLDQDWTVKIEEIHKSYEAKLALQIAAHNRTLDQLAKFQQQYRQLLEHAQKDRVISSKVYGISQPRYMFSPRGTTSAILPSAPIPNAPQLIRLTSDNSTPVTPQPASEQSTIGETTTGARFFSRPVNGQSSFNFVNGANDK